MKMAGRVMRCCVVLFFFLTSVSAAQKKLDSINALKKINFGQSVPKHSLVLLYWFANTVDMNNNNVITLTFDPNSDYGSHHYGNYEGLLDPLPLGNGHRYYTVGNLQERDHEDSPMPQYVVHPRREYVGRNRDRIIFRVRGQSRVDQVYITQHYDTSENQGTPYDPDHTYQITNTLLRWIRDFSVGGNQQSLMGLRNRYQSNADVSQIRNTWGDLAGLGLLLFIVIQERFSPSQHNNRRGNRQNNLDDDASESDRNVSRGFQPFQDDVTVPMNDVENQIASRMTENRRSGMSCCCICCICFVVVVGLILLCILLYLFSKRG